MQIFKKKPDKGTDSSGKKISPSERVKALYSQGLSEVETIKILRKEGYKAKEVEMAMDQALKDIAAGESAKLKTMTGDVSVRIEKKPAPKGAQKVTVNVFDSAKGVPKPSPPKAAPKASMEVPKPPKPAPKADDKKPPTEIKKGMDEIMRAFQEKPAPKPAVVNISIFQKGDVPKPPAPLRKPAQAAKKAPKPKEPELKRTIEEIKRRAKAAEKPGKQMADMKRDIMEVKKAVQKPTPAPVVNISIKPEKPAIPKKAAFKPMPKKPAKTRPAAKPAKPEKREKVAGVTFRPATAKLMVTKADVKRLESGISDIKKNLRKMPKVKPVPGKPAKITKPKKAKRVKHRPKPVKDRRRQKSPSVKMTVGEEISGLRGSMKVLDKSIMRLGRDTVKLDEKIPTKGEIGDMISQAVPKTHDLAEGEIKALKMLAAKPDYFDSQAAGLMKKVDDLMDVVDMFTDKVNTLQKNFVDVKTGLSPRQDMESSRLGQRVGDIEELLQNMAAKPKTSDEMRAATDRIARLERAVRAMAPRDAKPDSLAQKVEYLEASTKGIHDKLSQLSGDMDKLLDYFMQSIKRMERPRPEPRPTPAQSPAPQPAPRPKPQTLPPPPEPDRENTIFTRLRDSTVQRRPYPEAARYDSQAQRMPSAPSPPAYEPPEEPGMGEPQEGTMESEDIEILQEHITESMRRREPREKIMRDLMNAGYEQDQIARAFTATRMQP